jgi:hypothetical protein
MAGRDRPGLRDVSLTDSIEDYVARALQARLDQGLPEHIEDEAALDDLARLLSPPTSSAGADEPRRQTTVTLASHNRRAPSKDVDRHAR